MAEYIERTPELILAVNAGARAIENIRRYHSTVYMKDIFDSDKGEIAYLQAAKVLRNIENIPAAEVTPVVRCEKCEHWDSDPDTYGTDDGPKGKCMKSFETTYVDDFCSYGELKEHLDGMA